MSISNIDLAKALRDLYPEKEWVWRGDTNDISGLEWLDDSPKPTKEQLLSHKDLLIEKFNKDKYKRDRASEYPPIGDQLDALFHAGVFPDEMAEKIQAVKDMYPKEI